MKHKPNHIPIKFVIFFLLLQFTYVCQFKAQSNRVPDLVTLNKVVDDEFVKAYKYAKPLIGVSAMSRADGGSYVPGAYLYAIEQAGGSPVIIPVTTDADILYNTITSLDGLIFTGGADIAPLFYNEVPETETLEIDSVRDIFDLMLIKVATDRNIPILGICRGHQLINVAFGGTLYQDIPSQYIQSDINHKSIGARDEGVHTLSIEKETALADILSGWDELLTNSFHHQSVKNIAPNFRVAAQSSDGIVEAIETYPNRTILGVQWHPEAHVAAGDTIQLKIFKHMIHQAEIYKQAKALHRRILSVDTHADTPLCFERIQGFDFGKRETNQVNLPKMEEGMLDAIFLAAYQAQGERDAASSQKAVDKVNSMIDNIEQQVQLNNDKSAIAFTAQDLIRLKKEGKKAIFIGIENGYGIGKDIRNLSHFKSRGVNYMTLCHTKDNDICDTSSDNTKEWGGLSPFGYKVIEEMNRIGMVIDISHAGENTFWDVIKVSKKPIVATHSSSRALCDHDRNLTDDQLRAIANINGVVQVCPVDLFINEDKDKASLEDYINHIDHIVKIAGIDHVGIGSDFDGGGGLIGIQGANDLINITVKLVERGYSEDDIAKIWGGNFLRVLNEVQSVSE